MGSCVSEHAKDGDQFVDWASVKHIGQENHLLPRTIHEGINIHTRRPTKGKGPPPSSNFIWSKFAASLKRGCKEVKSK